MNNENVNIKCLNIPFLRILCFVCDILAKLMTLPSVSAAVLDVNLHILAN